MTIGERYDPAMAITDEARAADYFAWLVTTCMEFGNTRDQAQAIERENLGYYAGYFDQETRERVKRLYNASHPIFGDTTPTFQQAYAIGLERGNKAAQRAHGPTQ